MAYSLAVKLPAGELADDWVHTALHVATGVAVALVGWSARSAVWARVSTFAILVGYGALGVVGWFVDGLWMGSALRVPLTAPDNVFHLVLAVAAAASVASVPLRRKAAAAAAALAALLAVGVPAAAGGGEQAPTPIVFWRACGTGCGDIHVVRPGERERRVTRSGQAIEPAWTPDRRAVVFASDRGRAGLYALYRLRLSDGRHVRLTRPPQGASDAMPAVRKDGAVAFVRTWLTRERSELVLLHRGELRILVRARGLADPAWSSDGRRLAYTAVRKGTSQVLMLELASGRTRQPTATEGAQPAWSPDGRRLVYVRAGAGLYVHELGSGRVRHLVRGAGAYSPDFSPDGRQVVFAAEVSEERAGTALFVVGAEGGKARQVTRPPARAHDVGADW